MKINRFRYKWFFLSCAFCLTSYAYAAVPGEDMYLENCRSCHAADGSGSMGWVPDLTADMTWMTMDENELLNELKLGVRKSGAKMRMPAKGGNSNLTDDNLIEIIRYMKVNFKK